MTNERYADGNRKSLGDWALGIHWSLRHWSLVIGHVSLVIGHWSLVIGHWSLVIGQWSLVIGHWPWAVANSRNVKIIMPLAPIRPPNTTIFIRPARPSWPQVMLRPVLSESI